MPSLPMKNSFSHKSLTDGVLYHAAAVRDAVNVNARPGVVLVDGNGRIAFAGVGADMTADQRAMARQAREVDLGDVLLLPGMVNAHSHLELHDVGPQPYGGEAAGGFMGWVGMLRSKLPAVPDVDASPSRTEALQPFVQWFADSAGRGARAARAVGVAAVGDISRFEQVDQAVRQAGLAGVGFRELFGLGTPFDEDALAIIETMSQIQTDPSQQNGAIWRHGVQPHAPYSAGPRLYEAAGRSSLPCATHLAETCDEIRFVAEAAGPMRDFLQKIGKWDERFAQGYGQGLSPVQWIKPYLAGKRWVLAHVNYADDADIALLANARATVAYCPVASDYFGHHRNTPHSYREMLEAGVAVALGTDSVVCQPAEQPQPMSVLAQMRHLYRRDATDPATLLAMATTHGAKALGLPQEFATLQPGASAGGLAAVAIEKDCAAEPLEQVLESDCRILSI